MTEPHEIITEEATPVTVEKFLGMTKTTFVMVALLACVAFTFLSVGALGYSVRQNRERANEIAAIAEAQLQSTCADKAYTQKRIESTAQFLAEHGGPEPIPGISRETLAQSLEDLRTRRDTAFEGVDCPGP